MRKRVVSHLCVLGDEIGNPSEQEAGGQQDSRHHASHRLARLGRRRRGVRQALNRPQVHEDASVRETSENGEGTRHGARQDEREVRLLEHLDAEVAGGVVVGNSYEEVNVRRHDGGNPHDVDENPEALLGDDALVLQGSECGNVVRERHADERDGAGVVPRQQQRAVDLVLTRARREVHGHDGPRRQHVGEGEARE